MDAVFNRGLINVGVGELVNAVADFTAVIRTNPTDPAAYTGRAEAYRELGDLEEATNDLRRTTELDPTDAESKAALQGLLVRRR
jgi:Flp pilus assembly protein TadD